MKTTELITSLKTYDGKYKKTEIEELLNRKEEAIPLLINVLEQVLEDIDGYTDAKKDYWDHLYAFNFLGSLCVEKSHDIIIKLFSLPNSIPDLLWGDTVTEDLSVMLLRTCGGDLTKIKSLIENNEVYVYCRSAAVDTLAYAMVNGDIERHELIEYYRGLLLDKPDISNEDEIIFYNSMVCTVCYVYPEELMELIKDCFDKGYIDNSYIGYNSFLETVEEGKEHTLDALDEKLRMHQINCSDIHALQYQACFKTDDIKEELNFLSQYTNASLPSKNAVPKKPVKQTKSKKKQAKASKKANRKKKKK